MSPLRSSAIPAIVSAPYLGRLAGPLPPSNKCPGSVCGGDIEGGDSSVEILAEDPLEDSFEMPTSMRRRKELQARSDL